MVWLASRSSRGAAANIALIAVQGQHEQAKQ
jgi:hypothetical protein